MTTAERPNNEPTPEQILGAFSHPTRRCLRAMCKTPDSSVAWYNSLADVRAALKVGVEVMETSAREEAQANGGKPTPVSNMKILAASHALATTTAIECCMSIIERLVGPHLVVRENLAGEEPSPDKINGMKNSGAERFRRLDLD